MAVQERLYYTLVGSGGKVCILTCTHFPVLAARPVLGRRDRWALMKRRQSHKTLELPFGAQLGLPLIGWRFFYGNTRAGSRTGGVPNCVLVMQAREALGVSAGYTGRRTPVRSWGRRRRRCRHRNLHWSRRTPVRGRRGPRRGETHSAVLCTLIQSFPVLSLSKLPCPRCEGHFRAE